MKWTSWVSLIGIVGVVTVVVWSSFRVGAVRCEVCMTFAGRQACRIVDADTEGEARSGAVTNACALVASGVTDTMACQRSEPTRAECHTR